MAFPGFLGPSTTIAAQPQVRAAAPGIAPTSGKLAFAIQAQLQSNWCWAAVSTSVSHFFSAASTWTQCLVANTALPRPDCCAGGAGDPSRCNKPWYLDVALTTTGNLRQAQARPLSFAEVQTEIAASKPVGSRVGWFGGGGHFMTIVGWLVAANGDQYIDIADPIFLNSQIPYNAYAGAYQSGGNWTHSYLTQTPQARAALGGDAAQNALANVDLSSIGA